MTDELLMTIIVGGLVLFIIAILLGLSKKVVFYYDEGDLVLALMPWMSLIVTYILLVIYQPEGTSLNLNILTSTQTTISYIGFSISILFSILTVTQSIKHNKNIAIGIIVSIFKLLFSLLGIMILISQVFKMNDEKTKRNQFWFALLVFGAFWWLGKNLINGKKVYRDRGWKINN
ncbi:MAG: hypothetical protein PHP06_10180 [Clostridia bacterium]|nr:hypothetical protein [Clostridia bacterium]